MRLECCRANTRLSVIGAENALMNGARWHSDLHRDADCHSNDRRQVGQAG
jgi:hypothetical protein